MSLMAGFDIILELSNATVVKLLEANLSLATGGGTPPFDLDFGFAHMIVTEIKVALSGDTPSIELVFEDSSVLSPTVIAPLAGSVSIKVAIINPPKMAPYIDFSQVMANDITWTFTPESETVLEKAGYSAGQVAAIANLFVVGQIKSQPRITLLPSSITVVSGTDGGFLDTSVQLEAAEAHCVSDSDPAKQSLAICGTLLVAHDGTGNFANKTGSAIAPGDDACVSISPDAFHFAMVCPALRDTLLGKSGNTTDLPPRCGTSAGLNNANTNGLTLTLVTDSFVEGEITFDVVGTESPAAGVHVTVAVHGDITLAASGGTVTATANLTQPSVDVSIDAWVWVLTALGGGPIGAAATGIIQAAVQNTANNIANGFVKSFTALKTSFGVPDVYVQHVSTTAEGVTVSGTLSPDSIPLALPRARSVRLSGSVVTKQPALAVQAGTLHLTTGCPRGDYPYVEFSQQQSADFAISATLMGYPMTLKWTLGVGSSVVDLAAPSGTVSLPVECHYAFAPSVTQNVSVSYSIDSTPTAPKIHLENRAADGNYEVWLSVEATDPLGNVEYTATAVDFEGDHLAIGGSYGQDLADCIRALINKLKSERKAPNRVLQWEPVDHPTPDALGSLIREVFAVGGPASLNALVQMKLAHGASFTQALFASQQFVVSGSRSSS